MVKCAVHINHARWGKAVGYEMRQAERFPENCWVRCSWVLVTFLDSVFFLPSFLHLFPSLPFFCSSVFIPPFLPTFDPSSLPHFFTPVWGKCGTPIFTCLQAATLIPSADLCVLVKTSEVSRSYNGVQGEQFGFVDWTRLCKDWNLRKNSLEQTEHWILWLEGEEWSKRSSLNHHSCSVINCKGHIVKRWQWKWWILNIFETRLLLL